MAFGWEARWLSSDLSGARINSHWFRYVNSRFGLAIDIAKLFDSEVSDTPQSKRDN